MDFAIGVSNFHFSPTPLPSLPLFFLPFPYFPPLAFFRVLPCKLSLERSLSQGNWGVVLVPSLRQYSSSLIWHYRTQSGECIASEIFLALFLLSLVMIFPQWNWQPWPLGYATSLYWRSVHGYHTSVCYRFRIKRNIVTNRNINFCLFQGQVSPLSMLAGDHTTTPSACTCTCTRSQMSIPNATNFLRKRATNFRHYFWHLCYW